MKSLLIAFCVLSVQFGTSQAVKPSKVKIVLMGITHFVSSGRDVVNSKGENMLSASRQAELENLSRQLATFGFDKIFIEALPTQQTKYDSIYQYSYQHQLSTQSNERTQIGLRLAKTLGHPKVYCVDADGKWFFDSVMMFAQKTGQIKMLQQTLSTVQGYTAWLDSFITVTPLSKYIKYLNEPAQLMANHSLYNNILAKVSDGKQFPGPDLMGEWYKRNVRIYSNVMRQIEAGDRKVFVLFGQGHIYFLKTLFAANPDFEVVEVDTLLK